MILLFAAVFPFVMAAQAERYLFFAYTPEQCPKFGVFCKSETTFSFCYQIGDFVIRLSDELSCGNGYVCSTESVFACIPDTSTKPTSTSTTTEETSTTVTSTTTSMATTTIATTTIATTTTEMIVEPPDCHGASGYYPSSKCNQYYLCAPSFLWWWYQPYLQTCPDGEAYNGVNGCFPSSICKH